MPEVYGGAPFDGPAISCDQMGPISLKPIQGAGCAAVNYAPGAAAGDLLPQHGIRYIFGALDVHRDRLYARIRPGRAGPDVRAFMRIIRWSIPPASRPLERKHRIAA